MYKQNESGEWVKTRRRTQPKKKGKRGRVVTTGEKGTLNMGVVIRKAAELLRTNARKRVLKQPTTQLIDGKEVDTRVVKLFSTNSEDFVDESVVGMGSGLHMQGTWGRPLAELMAGETRTSIDKVRKSLFRRIPDTDTYTNEAARTEAQRWNHDIARREALFEFLADQQPAKSRFYKGSTVRDKKTKIIEEGNIHGEYYKKDSEDVKRFDYLSDWTINILKNKKVNHVYLEGYSMGSRGRVFHIAENTGVLKQKNYKAGITFQVVPPSTWKKEVVGKGNADKQYVYESLGIDLKTIFNSKSITSPINDIADSYFICEYGLLTNLPK